MDANLITAEEVQKLLGLSSRDAVYMMVARGQLPGVVRIGRRLRFERETLVAWIRRKSCGQAGGEDRR
jgi:excisionase family DNA binding protein